MSTEEIITWRELDDVDGFVFIVGINDEGQTVLAVRVAASVDRRELLEKASQFVSFCLGLSRFVIERRPKATES